MATLGKGKSLFAFPTEYCVVDIETTGLNRTYDSIIEISALKYEEGRHVDTFHTLICPPGGRIPSFITSLTGISTAMVKNAPRIESVLGDFTDFVGDDVILGWNVGFDIGFLSNKLLLHTGEELKNCYVDVLRIARKVHPEFPSHKQTEVADYYGISAQGAHRAQADCLICNSCYEALKKEILARGFSLDEYAQVCSCSGAKSIIPQGKDFDESHPLYQKVCVFDGSFRRMDRKKVMQMSADVGAIPADNVTKKTSYLVIGSYSTYSVLHGDSSKQRKAAQYIEKGVPIQVLSEAQFMSLLQGKKPEGL